MALHIERVIDHTEKNYKKKDYSSEYIWPC